MDRLGIYGAHTIHFVHRTTYKYLISSLLIEKSVFWINHVSIRVQFLRLSTILYRNFLAYKIEDVVINGHIFHLLRV